MLNVSQIFNSSGEVGSWISSSNTNFTGSLELSLFFILGMLLLVAFMFKLPILLGVIVIFPIVLLFTSISLGMGLVLGLFILIIALGIFSMWFIK